MDFLEFPDDDPKRARRRPLLFFILGTEAVGALASTFTTPAISGWYAYLVHPFITPPGWLFAPVWTLLYALMAIAAWRVWKKTGLRAAEMGVYAAQLALNFGWTALFFAGHWMAAAFAEICLLLLAILLTTLLFARQDRWAGLLMLPYLAWTGFAAVLTHGFWVLNP